MSKKSKNKTKKKTKKQTKKDKKKTKKQKNDDTPATSNVLNNVLPPNPNRQDPHSRERSTKSKLSWHGSKTHLFLPFAPHPFVSSSLFFL